MTEPRDDMFEKWLKQEEMKLPIGSFWGFDQIKAMKFAWESAIKSTIAHNGVKMLIEMQIEQQQKEITRLKQANDTLVTSTLVKWEAKCEKLEAQLNEAREVIGYYANRCNWSNADELCWDSVIDEEDHESIFGVNAVGGKRARAFLDKTKGDG